MTRATPLGMWPRTGEAAPVPREALESGAAVVATNYNPRRTRLLEEAEGRGFRTLEGRGMLVHQGALSTGIGTGREAPLEAMWGALAAALDLKKSGG